MSYTNQELFDLLESALSAYQPQGQEETEKKAETQQRVSVLGPDMLELEEAG